MKNNRARKASGHRATGDRFFSISIKLISTGETFKMKEIHNDMKISDLMANGEFVTGIPKSMQRLRYLDECDLLDSSTVRKNDIVGGAQLSMTVWDLWTTLVQAVAANDIEQVFKLGVSQESNYTTPNLDYMMPFKRRTHLSERAFVALFIAAHRGHTKLVEKLISEGADVNAKTQLGRTALHAASAQGHGTILDLLLQYGADIDAEDIFGDNALTIAGRFGHKGCERHLFLFRWQQRAKQARPPIFVPMFAHQYYDSALPVWFKGPYQQLYFRQILPPGEFDCTTLSAKKRPNFRGYGKDGKEIPQIRVTPHVEFEVPDEDDTQSWSEDEDGSLGRLPKIHENAKRGFKKTRTAFDIWLEKKKIEDAVRISIAKEQKQKKKEAEDQKALTKQTEDWKKAEEQKAKAAEKSYDRWLAEQEQSSRTKGSGGKGSSSLKSTQEIIRNLLARKQLEEGYHGLPYEIWTAEREPKLYNQIKVHGNLLLEHYNKAGS